MKPASSASSYRSGRIGTTLIEVMLALLILTIVALGVASYIYYSRASVYAQRDRLSVLELVVGRLEQLRADAIDDVSPPSENYTLYYMVWNDADGDWDFSTSETDETITVNSRPYLMTTTVQYEDIDGGSASYDILHFVVSMQYRTGSDDVIALRTYRAP
jgi:type II secretory pathway pseudopilin PulG